MNASWTIAAMLALGSIACVHTVSPPRAICSPARRRLLQDEENILPPLPDGFGPWSPHFTNSIAICTTMRNENATDIREWIQYYKWLGIDHIYLFENNSEHPIKDALKDHIESGFVTYETEDTSHAQMLVYRRCLENYRELYNWMAFFDADEFLAVRQENVTLKQVLDDYRHFPGLGVHWIMMGANGRETRPESGGVLRHYTQCLPEVRSQIKIIANMFFVQAIGRHPHNMFFRGRGAPVNDARFPIPYHPMSSKCTTESCHAHPESNQALPELRSANRLALFHYVTKSLEDFKIKVERGHGGSTGHKTMPYFDIMQEGQTDEPICKELEKIADECCPEVQGTSEE